MCADYCLVCMQGVTTLTGYIINKNNYDGVHSLTPYEETEKGLWEDKN